MLIEVFKVIYVSIFILQNPRRGKCCFELTLPECSKSVVLSAESEADLEDWMDKLTRIIHAEKPQEEVKFEKGSLSYCIYYKKV